MQEALVNHIRGNDCKYNGLQPLASDAIANTIISRSPTQLKTVILLRDNESNETIDTPPTLVAPETTVNRLPRQLEIGIGRRVLPPRLSLVLIKKNGVNESSHHSWNQAMILLCVPIQLALQFRHKPEYLVVVDRVSVAIYFKELIH
jgi:hypothetical protein